MLNALLAPETPVEQGAFYRRASGGSVVETAEVLDIARDRMGIPHVRFELRVARGTDARIEQRTLALETFYARYKERVGN